jgi:DNA-binding SARP family transcriptional activator
MVCTTMDIFTRLTAPITLSLLGSFELRVGAQGAQPALDRKTRAILAYLAATCRPHSRQSLLRLFCQEADDPAGNLRWHLSRIRRQLDPQVLLGDRAVVQLNRQAVWVDCDAFQQALEAPSGSTDPDMLAGSVDLYRGEFLEGMALAHAPEFELWLLGERSRYRRLYQRGLARLVEDLIAATRYEQAIPRARQLVQSDPLLEAAHMRLAWLYARIGQREAALKQLQEGRDLLQRELAVEPAPEFVRLHHQILHHAAGVEDVEVQKTDGQIAQALFATASAPLVGRDVELKRLQHAWQAAQRQGGVVALIDAVAGGGKTRLVQEFGLRVPEALLLVGRCFESTRTMPYHPWIDLLQARLALVDDSDLERISSYWLDQLTRLVPDLSARRGRPRTPLASPAPSEQEHVFAAVVEVLLRLPGVGGPSPPLLLLIDDLQWADAASLRLFHFVAQRIQRRTGVPAMLLGAFRSEEVEDNPALLALIRDLHRASAPLRLTLPPLAAAAVAELMAHLWPELPPGYRTPHIRDMLVKATGGNALFVTELLRELGHANTLPSTLPIPPSMRDFIQRRLRQLNGSGRQVIEAFAVLDMPATLDQARQISGRNDDEAAAAIDLGLRWRLLRSLAGAQPPRFDFGHDLMREAVAAQLSDVRRQRLHARAATTLEQSGAPAASLAYHWRMAGDSAKEARYAALAGEAAAAVFANDEAARYLQRALELSGDPRRRADLMLKLGAVWSLTGQWAEAEAIERAALELLADHDAARLRARGYRQLGWLKYEQGVHAEALALLEQAQHICETFGDQQGLCAVLEGIGMIHTHHGHLSEALACFEQWRRLGADLGDRLQVAKATGRMGVVYSILADSQRAVACFEQYLHIATELGDRLSLGNALGNLANVYLVRLYDYARSWEYRQQELHVWTEISHSRGIAQAIGNLTVLYLNLGAYTHALRCSTRHLQLCLDLGERLGVRLAVARIAWVFAEQRHYQQAERWFQRAYTLGHILDIPYQFCYELVDGAKLYLRQQRYADARRLADEALAQARAARRPEIELSALVLSIRLRAALHEIDAPSAVQGLAALLTEWPAARDQAAIHYALWQVQRDPARSRRHAAVATDLYRDLYAQTHMVECRQRYEELTGATLPDPPALPPPPALIAAHAAHPAALLAQVDQLIGELAA